MLLFFLGHVVTSLTNFSLEVGFYTRVVLITVSDMPHVQSLHLPRHIYGALLTPLAAIGSQNDDMLQSSRSTATILCVSGVPIYPKHVLPSELKRTRFLTDL